MEYIKTYPEIRNSMGIFFELIIFPGKFKRKEQKSICLQK